MRKVSLLHSRFSVLMFVLFLLSITTVEHALAGSKSPATLTLEPFSVHAQRDMSFLQTAVRSMIASRLAASGKVKIVEPGADYSLQGTITAIGKGVSINATVLCADGSVPSASYVSSAANEDGIIAAVDELAAKIAAGSFGAEDPAKKVVAVAAVPVVAPAPASSAFSTAHPDRAFIKAAPVTAARQQTGHGAIVKASAVGAARHGFIKTQTLKVAMQDMAIGDIDGDGFDDVVLADQFTATVYRLQGKRLVKFAEISLPTQHKIVSLVVADVDGDGRNELYVSGAKKGRPSSLAVQWQGSAWHYLYKGQDWFVRPMQLPGRGWVLVGQGAGMNAPFAGSIYELRLEGTTLRHGEPLSVPATVNVFSFEMADLDGDGAVEVIAVDDSDFLRVMHTSGRLLWKSSDRFGGSVRYLGGLDDLRHRAGKPGHQEMDSIDGEEVKRVYLPTPILITDLNKDGLPDIIVNKNGDSASRFFDNIKTYPSGEIMGLTWDGLGLTELWRTKKVDGYVASYALRNQGQQQDDSRLYVGVVLSRSMEDFFSAKESTVLIFPMLKE